MTAGEVHHAKYQSRLTDALEQVRGQYERRRATWRTPVSHSLFEARFAIKDRLADMRGGCEAEAVRSAAIHIAAICLGVLVDGAGRETDGETQEQGGA